MFVVSQFFGMIYHSISPRVRMYVYMQEKRIFQPLLKCFVGFYGCILGGCAFYFVDFFATFTRFPYLSLFFFRFLSLSLAHIRANISFVFTISTISCMCCIFILPLRFSFAFISLAWRFFVACKLLLLVLVCFPHFTYISYSSLIPFFGLKRMFILFFQTVWLRSSTVVVVVVIATAVTLYGRCMRLPLPPSIRNSQYEIA